MSQPTEHNVRRNELHMSVPDGTLEGTLVLPRGARGVVLFAYANAAGRLAARSQRLAQQIGAANLATLQIELLTPVEQADDERDGELRFDLYFLAERLMQVTDLIVTGHPGGDPRLGYFGVSIGAAATLLAASQRAASVYAVVSCGGRPDLAGRALASVRAPTMLIAGGADPDGLAHSGAALDRLRAPKELQIVPRAGHLFEEPGALDEGAWLASGWFIRHLEFDRVLHRTPSWMQRAPMDAPEG